MRTQSDLIQTATGCSREEVAEVENIMRHVIFHSTLDWQSRAQLVRAAKQAYAVMKETQK
jgi:hypothetical protein